MKLKKIAALALAGVMAVSMLAGCKTVGTNDGAASSEETATATGYSAMLADEMKDLAGKDHITFKDNSSDEAALKFAVTAVANSDIATVSGVQCSGTAVYRINSNTAVATAFQDKAKADELFNSTAVFASTDAKEHLNGTYTWGILYRVDGSINMETVMAAIANHLKQNAVGVTATNLVESANTGDGSTYAESYEISVSVVNVPNTTDLQVSESTNVIAVTVTRTGVAD